ncbi:TPA: hypothetical protein ACKP1Z_003155 [Serratia marcescens]
MHSWRQQPLNIALMDRCPLTLEGLASFLKTLPTQAKVVVKETSVRAVADSVVYQQADVLISEMDGEDETVAQGRETLLALCT